MLNFTYDQLLHLERAELVDLSSEVKFEIREAYPDAEGLKHLDESVEKWIEAGRILGIKSREGLKSYVKNSFEINQVYSPLHERIQVYLRLYYPVQARAVDCNYVAHRACDLALSCAVAQEEGVCWLSVICLFMEYANRKEYSSLARIMNDAEEKAEEDRVLMVHQFARSKGWIQ